jgi:hypothetical protein
MPKETHFKVPEDYFEGFSARLNERLKMEGTVETSVEIPIWRSVRSMLGIAAGFAFFAILSFSIISYILNKNDMGVKKEIALNDSIHQENFINGSEREESADNTYMEEAMSEAYYEDYMIDYLVSEGIDIQLIAEEL